MTLLLPSVIMQSRLHCAEKWLINTFQNCMCICPLKGERAYPANAAHWHCFSPSRKVPIQGRTWLQLTSSFKSAGDVGVDMPKVADAQCGGVLEGQHSMGDSHHASTRLGMPQPAFGGHH